jgi:hypothetical protein
VLVSMFSLVHSDTKGTVVSISMAKIVTPLSTSTKYIRGMHIERQVSHDRGSSRIATCSWGANVEHQIRKNSEIPIFPSVLEIWLRFKWISTSWPYRTFGLTVQCLFLYRHT